MIFGDRLRIESRDAESAAREKIADLAAFPLVIPLIAGPGAITATLLLAYQGRPPGSAGVAAEV